MPLRPRTLILSCFFTAVLLISSLLRFSWDLETQYFLHLIIIPFAILFISVDAVRPFSWRSLAFPVFLVIALASFFTGSARSTIRDEWLVLFDAVLLMYLFSPLGTAHKKKLLLVPLCTGLALSAAAVLFALLNPGLSLNDFFLPKELAVNPNILASFLFFAFVFSFAYFESGKLQKAATLALFAGILLTRSRTVMFISVISFFAYYFAYARRRMSGNAARLSFIGAAAAIIIAFVVTGIKTQQYSGEEASFLANRELWWNTAISMFKDNPLTGVGWGNYFNYSAVYRISGGLSSIYAHNIFFQVAAETGIFGLLSFLALLFIFMRGLILRFREAGTDKPFILSLLIAASGFIVINCFDYSFYVPPLMFLFFMCLSPVGAESRSPAGIFPPMIVPRIVAAALVVWAVSYPLAASARSRNAALFMAASDYHSAASELLASVKLDSINSSYRSMLAQALFGEYRASRDRNILAGSIAAQKEAVRLFPENHLYHSDLAWLYWSAGDRENAVLSMNNAMKFDRFNKKYQDSMAIFGGRK